MIMRGQSSCLKIKTKTHTQKGKMKNSKNHNGLWCDSEDDVGPCLIIFFRFLFLSGPKTDSNSMSVYGINTLR